MAGRAAADSGGRDDDREWELGLRQLCVRRLGRGRGGPEHDGVVVQAIRAHDPDTPEPGFVAAQRDGDLRTSDRTTVVQRRRSRYR